MANSDINLAVYLSVMTLRETGYLSLPTTDKEVKQWQRGKSHELVLITKGALPKHANCIPRSSFRQYQFLKNMLRFCLCNTISISMSGKVSTFHKIIPIEKSTYDRPTANFWINSLAGYDEDSHPPAIYLLTEELLREQCQYSVPRLRHKSSMIKVLNLKMELLVWPLLETCATHICPFLDLSAPVQDSYAILQKPHNMWPWLEIC